MIKKLLIALFFILPFTIVARQSNNYISYEYESTNRYKILLHVYRDCRGVSLGNTASITVSSGASCFTSVNLVLNKDTIINRAVKCPSSNICGSPNTNGNGFGMEEHVFSGIMDLDSAAFSDIKNSNCCEIYFGYQGSLRSSAITTGISGSGYNYAFLNRCIGNNSSVYYTNKYPYSALCNNTFEYNPMAIDPDGDSLVFELDTPLISNRTTNAAYSTPLNASIPITPVCVTQTVTCAPALFSGIYIGFDFNKVTNNMRLTPANCNEVTVFVNTTKEYRKDTAGIYRLIGETRKEHLLFMGNAGNNIPPSINLDDAYYACIGDSLLVNVASADKAPTGGVSDTTFLTWSHNISNLTVEMNDSSDKNQSATIKWAPQKSDISNIPYVVNFAVSESNCISNSQASKSTAIYVVDSLTSNPTVLDRKNGTLYLNANITGGSPLLENQITWVVADNPQLNNATIRNKEVDSIIRLNPGKHYYNLIITNGSNCAIFVSDSIVIDPYFRFNFNNVQSEYCKNNLTSIQPNILNANRPITYEWYIQGSPIIISSDSILERIISGPETYFLTAKDNSGKSYSLNFSATTLELPDLSSVKNPEAKCLVEGQFDLFKDYPIGIDLDQSTKDSNFITFKTVNNKRSGMVKSGLGNPYWYFAQNFFDSSLNQNYIPNPPVDSLRVYATNFITGCSDSSLFLVNINRNPEITLVNKTLCQNFGSVNPNDLLLVEPSDLSNGEFSWSIDSAPAGLNPSDIAQILKDTDPSPFNKEYAFYPYIPGSSPSAPFNKNRIGKYKLRFCFTNNTTQCQSCGFAYLEVIESPDLTLKPFTNICYNEGIVELDSNANLTGGIWSLISFNNLYNGSDYDLAASRISNNQLNLESSPIEGGDYFVKYINTTQTCPVEDSVHIVVGAQPNLKLNTYADSIYLGESITLRVLEGTNWNLRWENGNISPSRQIREFPLNAGKYNFIMTATNPANNCKHSDTAIITVFKDERVGVKSLFVSNLNIYPNPAKKNVNIQSKYPIKSLQLLTIEGQLLYQADHEFELNLELDLSKLSGGTYYLGIKGETETHYVKLTVIK
jgi:hypothetical protein